MPVPCPCCRAANESGPLCRRCKTDLALLFAVEAERTLLIDDARREAEAARYPESLAVLDRAAQLRRGDDIRRKRAAVLMLAGDFPAALSVYDNLVGQGERSA